MSEVCRRIVRICGWSNVEIIKGAGKFYCVADPEPRILHYTDQKATIFWDRLWDDPLWETVTNIDRLDRQPDLCVLVNSYSVGSVVGLGKQLTDRYIGVARYTYKISASFILSFLHY